MAPAGDPASVRGGRPQKNNINGVCTRKAKPLLAVDVGQALGLAERRLGRADELRVTPGHGEGQRHGRRIGVLLRFALEVLEGYIHGSALMAYWQYRSGATF